MMVKKMLFLLVLLPVFLAAAEEEVRKIFSANQLKNLELKNINGNLNVIAENRENLEIIACKKAKCPDALEKLEVIFKIEDSGLKIDVDYPEAKKFNQCNLQVDFEIRLPAGIALRKVQIVNGNVFCQGLEKGTRIKVVNGNFELTNCAGEIELNLVNGNIQIETCSGRVKAEIVNGEIVCEVLPQLREADLEITNGTITLKGRREVFGLLQLKTVNGQIKSEFPLPIREIGSRPELKILLNQLGASISAQTVNGNIQLMEI